MFAGADRERRKRVLTRFLDERRQRRRRHLGERWEQRARASTSGSAGGVLSEQIVTAKFAAGTSLRCPGRPG